MGATVHEDLTGQISQTKTIGVRVKANASSRTPLTIPSFVLLFQRTLTSRTLSHQGNSEVMV
ncbi:hypothetical protein PAXRUDRAFT_835665 [Paxillus rubicundulus Ve08.2h10]|uniref:Uncharacterized protein n=1 Tax=Paxillus rubicundulus Ve08.2h10 TaxID=930991 RepID=A0A0D0DDJ1_9AGAM|nr:hypothetical protein PAXRUDRAFT_835665 [Paxillus rubicundulus Ve08.2h10]